MIEYSKINCGSQPVVQHQVNPLYLCSTSGWVISGRSIIIMFQHEVGPVVLKYGSMLDSKMWIFIKCLCQSASRLLYDWAKKKRT